jgi:hypothetical protein
MVVLSFLGKLRDNQEGKRENSEGGTERTQGKATAKLRLRHRLTARAKQ